MLPLGQQENSRELRADLSMQQAVRTPPVLVSKVNQKTPARVKKERKLQLSPLVLAREQRSPIRAGDDR